MCCLLAAKSSSLRIGQTEEVVLTLTFLAHPYSAVLSTYVWMCAKGYILGAKSRICISSSPSSRLFIVISPLDLEEYTRRTWVAWEKGEHQTKYCPPGYRNTPPIPDPDETSIPIQDREKVYNLRRWLVLSARLQNNSLQDSRFSCTSIVIWTCRPAACFRGMLHSCEHAL